MSNLFAIDAAREWSRRNAPQACSQCGNESDTLHTCELCHERTCDNCLQAMRLGMSLAPRHVLTRFIAQKTGGMP